MVLVRKKLMRNPGIKINLHESDTERLRAEFARSKLGIEGPTAKLICTLHFGEIDYDL